MNPSSQMQTQIHIPLQSAVDASRLSAYVVGRDADGQWVAVETHGRAGGFFRSREAAADYAAFETDHRSDAVRFASEPVSLRI